MPKRVLVIDDDRNSVKYLSAVLSEHGYDPVAAYDGNEGLEKIVEATPDLIVLDVMMPKKTGFVLFAELKKDERYNEIPILMLTGVGGVLEDLEDHMDEAFEKPYDKLRESLKKKIREMRDEGLVRPDMFVDKPVDPDSFIAKVQQLIGS
jgi:two-component system alkaline phosphatase synthesis response regulator PhoP